MPVELCGGSHGSSCSPGVPGVPQKWVIPGELSFCLLQLCILRLISFKLQSKHGCRPELSAQQGPWWDRLQPCICWAGEGMLGRAGLHGDNQARVRKSREVCNPGAPGAFVRTPAENPRATLHTGARPLCPCSPCPQGQGSQPGTEVRALGAPGCTRITKPGYRSKRPCRVWAKGRDPPREEGGRKAGQERAQPEGPRRPTVIPSTSKQESGPLRQPRPQRGAATGPVPAQPPLSHMNHPGRASPHAC